MSDQMIEVAPEGARMPRAERRQRAESQIEIQGGDGGHAGPSAEDALAEAQRIILDRENQIQAEREGRNRAEREAQRAHAGRAQATGAAVANAVEAATAAITGAESKARAARESGDLDEEMKAMRELASAQGRLDRATEAQSALERGDPTSGAGNMDQPEPATPNGVSQATQNWIARHPRFNSDRDYKATMLAVHADLITDGIQADSPAYFRALDAKAAELEGGRQEQRTTDMSDRQRGNFSGAPPNRGGGGGGSSGNVVQTPLGPVTVSRLGNGKMGVQVSDQHRQNFEDGARVCGMDLGAYIMDQVNISRTEAQGGNTGLIVEEGRRFR
jgi:hypothetical protein